MQHFPMPLSQPLIEGLGWAVIHSFWQAALVALGLGGLSLLLRHRPARVRYWTAKAGLLSVLVLFGITFWYFYSPENTSSTIPADSLLGASPLLSEMGWEKTVPTSGFLADWAGYFESHLPLIVSVWLLGMVLFLLRFLGGLAYLHHLRIHRSRSLGSPWSRLVQALSDKMNVGRRVKLAESAWVHTPMVIGWIKPVILFPVGMVNQLSQEQVEAVLAHELGHIKRFDFLFNLLQSLVEVLLYFNPAVWWISSLVRTERENCCDDLAIAACGDTVTYARTLVQLQELTRPAPPLALAFSRRKSPLLDRVRRILQQPVSPPQIRARVLSLGLIVAALLGFSFQQEEAVNRIIIHEAFSEATLEDLDLEWISVDTLPDEEARVKFSRDGKTVEAYLRKGVITSLKVDGVEVPEEEYADYEEEISRILQNLPGPPPPPPAPPAPPRISPPPPPPPPPAPPAPAVPRVAPPPPPIPGKSGEGLRPARIVTRQGEKGTTFIILESMDGADSIRIRVDTGQSSITIDEMEVRPGETTLLLGDLDIRLPEDNLEGDHEGGYRFFFNEKDIDGSGYWWKVPDGYPSLEGRSFGEDLHFEFVKPDTFPEEWFRSMKQLTEEQKAAREEWIREMKERNWEVDQYQSRLQKALRQSRESELLKQEKVEQLLREQKLKVEPFPGEIQEKAQRERAEALVLRGSGREFSWKPGNARYRNLDSYMIEDGLIQPGQGYSYELTASSFQINGKKQPDEIHRKYLERYRKITGQTLSGKSKVSIRKSLD